MANGLMEYDLVINNGKLVNGCAATEGSDCVSSRRTDRGGVALTGRRDLDHHRAGRAVDGGAPAYNCDGATVP